MLRALAITIAACCLLTAFGCDLGESRRAEPGEGATPQSTVGPTVTSTPRPTRTATPMPVPTLEPTVTATPKPTRTATPVPVPTPELPQQPIPLWRLGKIALEVSQEEWGSGYRGRTVQIDAFWEESWVTHDTPPRHAKYRASLDNGITAWAHLKRYTDEATLSGVWECRLGDVEGGKYKRLNLLDCTLVKAY